MYELVDGAGLLVVPGGASNLQLTFYTGDPEERENLEKLQISQDRLENSILHLDETYMILNDF